MTTIMKALKCPSCGAPVSPDQTLCSYCGSFLRKNHQIIRRRGTAIVQTRNGILVIAGRGGLYLLPGGGAKKHESRERAAIRELKEETGLLAKSVKYLFSHDDPDDGRKIRNLHKVFLMESDGKARRLSRESRHIAYWKPDSEINVSKTTRAIIEKYLATT